MTTTALLVLFMPAGFPDSNPERRTINFGKLKEIDYLGAILIFATSAFIVSALQEAGTAFAWSSATIIVLIVLTGICISGFLAWQYFIDKRVETRKPVLTWRL